MTDPQRDEAARAAALDPARSFVVQAPAGSGKTGLLTQRYLRLLEVVEAPEQIVAITFTRKAAAQMRHQVIEALHEARKAVPKHLDAHARRTRELARAALERAESRAWDLMAHPARLRMVQLLLAGRYTVGELAAACDVASHVASEHLRLLERCGLLGSDREGRRAYYRIAEPHLAAIIDCIEGRFGGGGNG